MKKTILMLGTFDSKGNEFDYLHQELNRRNVEIISMNTGIFEPVGTFPIQIQAQEVAAAGGIPLLELRSIGDRGLAMKTMCAGAALLVEKLQKEHAIHGIIGMGGGGGTAIAAKAMQALPLGFPKVCITTLASGDTREYVGTKDILLFPSIVDICGINRFTRMIISRAAGAVCGMVETDPPEERDDRPIICLSMFGNSTACVERCSKLLEQNGYAPLVFHATGTGGRSMEDLILEKYCTACLDITVTEWADEICGGVLSAGTKRLDGPGIAGIPHVIVPGCLDMVNFGSRETVPEYYKNNERLFYEWNPMATLMRTNKEENARLGKILAEKANRSEAPTAFVLPMRGLSVLDGQGQVFCDWETDQVLFDAIEQHLNANIPVIKVDANINDAVFSEKAVAVLLKLINEKESE